MRVLLINGPNLGTLGTREPEIYGHDTLADIVRRVEQRAVAAGVEVVAFQSNHEGGLIDFIETEAPLAAGLIINPGALAHGSIALRDAIAASGLLTVEVHISNVFARERFRHRSVISAVCLGLISGLGWRGYVHALDSLVAALSEAKEPESIRSLKGEQP
jgi:3-dehydroquinate dehydratase-2